MADPFAALEDWAEPLLARLSSGERRKLAGTIGRELRRAQHARIQNQTDADGNAFIPRKRLRDQAGRIRKTRDDKLFRKISKSDYLRVKASADGVVVGFFSRVERIARVHQEGLVDSVNPGGPSVRYPKRKLIGFNDQDRDSIRAMLLRHLAGNG